MANSLGGMFRFPHQTPNLGLGLGGLGLASTKGPKGVDRHEDEGWSGWMKSKGGKKNNVAMSALTLLAFLFFLNILQNCMQEHMDMDKNKGHGYNPNMMNNFNNTPIIYVNSQRRDDDAINVDSRGDSADLSNENMDSLDLQHRSDAISIDNKKRIKSNYKKKDNKGGKEKVFQKISTVEKLDSN